MTKRGASLHPHIQGWRGEHSSLRLLVRTMMVHQGQRSYDTDDSNYSLGCVVLYQLGLDPCLNSCFNLHMSRHAGCINCTRLLISSSKFTWVVFCACFHHLAISILRRLFYFQNSRCNALSWVAGAFQLVAASALLQYGLAILPWDGATANCAEHFPN